MLGDRLVVLWRCEISVFIHSKITILREAIRLLLEEQGCQTETEVLEKADVAVWDLSGYTPPYPQPTEVPTLAILSANDTDIARLLHLRYRGVLKPTDGGAVLKKALSAIRRGEIWAERKHLTLAYDQTLAPRLTRRESQTLQLLSKGLSNRAIAERLKIAEGTVKMHVSHIFDKYNVHSRTELLCQLRGP